MTEVPPSPRSWYLSLTLIWQEAEGRSFVQLQDALRELAQRQFGREHLYPSHHLPVLPEAQHSTAFAILKINRVPCAGQSLREFARELLTLLATPALLGKIGKFWGRSLKLKAHEVRAYDDNTTVQFRPSDVLSCFREKVRTVLAGPVGNLVATYPSGFIEPLLHDCNKSSGDKAFGSIARSPCRSDKPDLRWKLLFPHVEFEFKRVHLLTSDDALTNPRIEKKIKKEEIEDYPISEK